MAEGGIDRPLPVAAYTSGEDQGGDRATVAMESE
jgi:hypothetical protein